MDKEQNSRTSRQSAELTCYKPKTHFMITDCNTLVYSMKQDGWRKGEPVMVNDVEVRIVARGHDGETLRQVADCVAVALNRKFVNSGGL